jgi:serine-type D-Ala-D-Ala endopeptidase (penicillin-binding protein 7)
VRIPADCQRTVLRPRPAGCRAWALTLSLLLAVLLPDGVVGPWAGASRAEAATGRATSAPAAPKKTTKKSTRSRSSKSARVSKSKSKSTRHASTKRRSRKRTRTPRAYARYGSRAALVMDARTGEILFEKNSSSQLPVASLTKLMTNIVFLETDPDLDRTVTVTREDIQGSGHTQLRRGEILSVRELLYHSLMSSDNAATKTLVRASDVPPREFLDRMNRKASVLGLHSTRFVEFTGLDPANVSSAADLAQLLKYASSRTLIAEITSQPEYTYRSNRRVHHLVNSNRLARYGQVEVLSGKTGFIQSAGYCLATWVREGSRDLIAVVLGAPSNPARFNETRRLLQQVALMNAAAAPSGLPHGPK